MVSRARRMITAVLRYFVQVLGNVTPKSATAVVRTFPDYDDMLRSLAPGLIARGRRLTVLVGASRAAQPSWLPQGVDIAPVHSAKGFWRYLRAREIYFTHGLYGSPRPARGQTIVNVWHGMPLKRLDRYSHIATPPRFSFSVATSKYFAEILAGAFEVPEQDVEVIGLPRNDILVDSTIPDSRLVLQQLKVSSYIVMLPTFRTSTFGPRWRDGSDEILRIQPGQLDRLNGVLFEHGLALLLKAHPLASKAVMDSWRCDHSVMIDEDWLRSRGITLYGILGGASALITDYSSVAVDFMVTRRPCILYQPDSSDYGSLRGFAVSDDAWDTLGYRVTSIEALISQIDTLALEGYCVAPRRSPFLLTVPLAGAAERVFESVERRIACSSQKV